MHIFIKIYAYFFNIILKLFLCDDNLYELHFRLNKKADLFSVVSHLLLKCVNTVTSPEFIYQTITNTHYSNGFRLTFISPSFP